MKALVRRNYGGPEQLQIEEWPIPTPGHGELLIRVMATTVNRTDCGVLTGKPLVFRLYTGISGPKQLSPGTDFSGVVEAVGEGVSGYQKGDRVFGFMDQGAGTQAQYILYPQKLPLAHIPDGVDPVSAVASLEGAHYAINFLNKVDLKPGQRVMLNGASGAIGSAALQLLKSRGLWVTATCRGIHVDKIRAMGADRVIDYEKEDFTRDTERYDFVFDSVGKSRFGKCRRIMKPKGVYISSELGPRGENPFLAIITPWFGGKKVMFPLPNNIQASIDQMVVMLEKGSFHPMIDRTYPLEQGAEAYRYVLSGQKAGNVILDLTA